MPGLRPLRGALICYLQIRVCLTYSKFLAQDMEVAHGEKWRRARVRGRIERKKNLFLFHWKS